MKKLSLELDALEVETFGLGEHEHRRGTAHAHIHTGSPVEIEPATGWTGRDTCEGESCLQTCTFNTCLSCTETA